MKIIILGAGAIGSFIGALLSKDNDVLLIGRKAHVDEINKNGLQIKGSINNNYKVKAQTKLDKIDNNTLIILSTKVTDSEKTINEIKDLIKKDTIILCMQNGLGSEDIVKNLVDCEVLRGITTVANSFLEPGKINCASLGDIYLEKGGSSKGIVKMFNKAKLKAEISENIKERIWIKLFNNSTINTLTAIFNVKNGTLSNAQELINGVVHELVMVANKEGFNFDEKEVKGMIEYVIKETSENKSSTLQDILKNRKTEIDFLNGKVVELAKKHNLEVPINKTLVQMIKFKESNY